MVEIKKMVQDKLNEQINRELYSGYLYLSMAAYFESMNLKGFASWMKAQAEEEKGHAMRMYDYVYERGGKVSLLDIEAPPREWKSPADAFKHTYEHEKKVTQMINVLSELAVSEKDRATAVFLQWFITEQVEEEDTALNIVEKLKIIGSSNQGLTMLDRELSQRKQK
ncbi:MAG: ferritin [Candidatus Micrarchaeota archaeon]